ncbi:MAG: hypothetical protein EPO09_01260 [Aquabacterium sp.]|uniref:hypothetical protein n=1 Tax=Aquabacterium sp. TaxID=1872578 RepID=UPI00121ABC8D|nr:hypothetical protein [Aquabacterium sp.]TAK99357.1 MAG: hypothetical protein EPO09_01260 [Aquabacterium sp.]
MTKDEALAAISAAFGGAEAWAVVGNWVVFVETKPKREVALMGRFVETNILGDAMTPSDLTRHIQSIALESWAVRSDGVHQLILN